MNFFLYIFIFLSIQFCSAQLITRTFEEIDTLSIKKPLIVFLHTDWCKYCNVMEETTFKNKEVIEKLNSDYYFVSFDAESRKKVLFKNRIFIFKPTGRKTGIHELAETLGRYQNKLVYPTTVVLNTKHEIVYQRPSLLRPKNFIKLLKAIETHEKF